MRTFKIYWLTKTNGIRQLRLGHLHTAADINQQTLYSAHLLNQDNRTTLRMNRIPRPKFHPLDRCIRRCIEPRFTRCGKYEPYLVPRHRFQDTQSEFRFCFADPALSDLKFCHRQNVNEPGALVKGKIRKERAVSWRAHHSALSQREIRLH